MRATSGPLTVSEGDLCILAAIVTAEREDLPGTVRTHLENIYGRLQVSSRTAAVIRAFPDQVG